jgi:uncharacterized protein YdiU (UPF0061 family)
MSYSPDPQFARLGGDFADPVAPADFPQTQQRFWNDRWTAAIGLDDLDAEGRIAHFARFSPLPDNQSEPLAMRYHGHQFRHYNPQIGDGRGFLFAQLKDDRGRLLDLATKGSGQTPWSRQGDGRLTLKGAVREIMAAQLLEARGVYTSKPFAVFETGEDLHRHDEPSPTRSAVLTRLSHSHLRFGVFQRHAYEQRPDNIQALIEHAIAGYFPELEGAEEPAAALLNRVVEENARLAAYWMAAGFVHGVLNTDNLNLTGESFDYGPWRFLPIYEPGFTAAYFDENGLYAYGRQPEAVFWALQQFAGALSLVCETSLLETALNTFPERYRTELPLAFMARFGLETAGDEADIGMVRAFLEFMRASQAPWEGVFFDWFGGEASAARALEGPRAHLYQGDPFKAWRETFAGHAPARPERLEHAYFQGEHPADMVIERLEALWAPIADRDDWGEFHAALGEIDQARAAMDLGAGRAGFRA